MTTFVLVHGAYHGAWCWDRLVPELERQGHRAVAVNLPCDDAGAGFAEYTAAALAAMDAAGVGEDAIAVGHSLGGFTIPLIAEKRRIARLVFLCTAPTIAGTAPHALRASIITDAYSAIPRFKDPAGRTLFAPGDARMGFFHDCDDATAAWAVARLRPQGSRPLTEPWPLKRWPDAARSMILTRDDRAIRLSAAVEASRIILDGGEPTVLEGSHSPFLSRPAELAGMLDGLSRR
jgi:pimeloyl-ACP methyl ester carboxylesterase